MRHLIFTLVMIMVLSPPALSTTLFKITKSSNRNQVFYDLSGKEVVTYWRMLEDDGHVEDLTSFERSRVYGADVQASEDKIQIFVKALPAYPITVQTNNSKEVIGTMHLLGQDRVVKTVHLQLSGGLFPGVKWIEVLCQKNADELETIVLKEEAGNWIEKLKE